MTPSTHTADATERAVVIDAGGVALEGDLTVPPDARGLVMFAHGSGSSRHSFRNRYVADELQHGNLGTLLLDLLTPAEEQADRQTRHIRFDIGLLADRLIGAMRWLDDNDDTRGLSVGLFGASTGAGAALAAAARRPDRVAAGGPPGGRPPPASRQMPQMHAPRLQIVFNRQIVVCQMKKRT